MEKKHGIINAPISRKENSIIERCVNNTGDTAITDYYVIKELFNSSFIYITLQTGRTHQIRVHMSHIGHPILGDTLYGNASNLISKTSFTCLQSSICSPYFAKNI